MSSGFLSWMTSADAEAHLAAEMREEPEDQRKSGAEDETGDDGEIKCGVFAAMDDVAGKFSQTEREFAAEIEKCAEENKETAKKQEGAAEFAKRIHSKSLGAEEFPSQRPNAAKSEAACRKERIVRGRNVEKPMATLSPLLPVHPSAW
jgi:hypothetical protein